MLLSHAGYTVQEAYTTQEALETAQSGTASLVLICHTIPQSEIEWLITAIRKRRPNMPILCIDNTGLAPPSKECQTVSNAPEELLGAVRSALLADRQRAGTG